MQLAAPPGRLQKQTPDGLPKSRPSPARAGGEAPAPSRPRRASDRRQELLRILARREAELDSAREERRDKDAAISFLKTRIVARPGAAAAAPGGG